MDINRLIRFVCLAVLALPACSPRLGKERVEYARTGNYDYTRMVLLPEGRFVYESAGCLSHERALGTWSGSRRNLILTADSIFCLPMMTVEEKVCCDTNHIYIQGKDVAHDPMMGAIVRFYDARDGFLNGTRLDDDGKAIVRKTQTPIKSFMINYMGDTMVYSINGSTANQFTIKQNEYTGFRYDVCVRKARIIDRRLILDVDAKHPDTLPLIGKLARRP